MEIAWGLYIGVYIASGILFSALCGSLAAHKGYDGYYGMGFFLGFIGLVYVVGLPVKIAVKEDGLAVKWSGQKTRTYPDGSTYFGEWENGKPNGQGTLTSPDGRTYVGQWKDGKPNGQGKKTDADGSTYEGQWKDSQYNGRGTLTYSDGTTKVGIWENNEYIGE